MICAKRCNSSFGLACFVPSHEMADIAQVVTQRSRSEVFLRTHGLFIVGQCTRASRREPRIRLPFHAHLIRERTLAEKSPMLLTASFLQRYRSRNACTCTGYLRI